MTKLLSFIAALAAAVGGSQLPEFSQQYRQRLGGALQELEHVVVRFEQDAMAVGMTTETALRELESSSHALFKRRGDSMRAHVGRYQTLKQQQVAFENLDPMLRPIALLQGADRTTLEATWQVFEPAVPLTASGGLWAGTGALAGFLSLFVLGKLLRVLFRRRNKPAQPVRRKNERTV